MILKLLQKLPLAASTDLVLSLRNRFARTAWPTEHDSVHTSYTVERADAVLQDAHWEDASGYSLYYEGEVLNLRRPAGYHSDGTPLEAHLRARQDPETLSLEWVGHVEPSRFNAKEAHVHQEGLEWFDSVELRELLLEAGLETDVENES